MPPWKLTPEPWSTMVPPTIEPPLASITVPEPAPTVKVSPVLVSVLFIVVVLPWLTDTTTIVPSFPSDDAVKMPEPV